MEQAAGHCNWLRGGGRANVLVEHPDAAELSARAHALLEAGFDVASCIGPTEPVRSEGRQHGHARYWAGDVLPHDKSATACALLASGSCPLLDNADVVLSSPLLLNAGELHAELERRGSPRLVVELVEPSTPEAVVAEVEAALG